ncbi:hypothetical protein P9112_000868 [Eukaryota sp. TZLM1-RC]
MSLLEYDLDYVTSKYERIDFLPISESKKVGTFGVTFTLLKTYTSAGVLALPYGLYRGGIISVLLIPLALVLNLYSMLLLLRCRKRIDDVSAGASYSRLASACVGQRFGQAVNYCSKCFQLTVIITHLVFLCRFSRSLFFCT